MCVTTKSALIVLIVLVFFVLLEIVSANNDVF